LDPATLLAVAATAVVVFAGLRALAAYYSTIGFALVGNRVLTAVRNELYSQLQRLSLSFHNRARTGDLVMRVIGDVGVLQDVAVTAFLPGLANALTIVGMAAVMLSLNAPLALLALATGPLFLVSTARRSRRIHGTALVLWFGARFVLHGAMTPGDLIVFLAYVKNAFRPVKDAAKYTGRLARASAAGERVLDLLDRTPDVRDLPGAVPAPALRGA